MKFDMKNSIFTPSEKKAEKSQKEQQAQGTIFYVPYFDTSVHDVNGNGIGISEQESLAAKIHSNGPPKYFIKISVRGVFFDFTDPTHVGTITKVVNGIPEWTLREVKKEQFEHYLAFLRTSNKVFLSQSRQVF